MSWATQVLEQLAKSGLPSRAEISDAPMSERAECVMLNKGPYINDAVVAIDNILARMTLITTRERPIAVPTLLAPRLASTTVAYRRRHAPHRLFDG